MRRNLTLYKAMRCCMILSPFLVIIGLLLHLKEYPGEYSVDDFFLLGVILILVLNFINLFTLFLNDFEHLKKRKILFAFSSLFGTPIIILLWLGYHYTLRMNLDIEKSKYLRDECFMKVKNIYKAENRYHFHNGYCPSAVEDSIVVAEIYRWGTIKSCNIILKGKSIEIDTSTIDFLTNEEKKEILNY